MMLPILISVSLAPGSYFFCADAADAVSVAAAASAARARKLPVRAGVVLSHVMIYFGRVSQAPRRLASAGLSPLFRRTKRCRAGRFSGWVSRLERPA